MLKQLITPTGLLICLFLCSSNFEAGICIDDGIKVKIDEFVHNIMGCRKGIGLSLAVVHNDDIYTKGFGIKNLETRENVTSDTLFDIASVSKHFASTVLGILLEENDGLNWDTPVRDIVGEDFFFYDGLRSNRTTLRDLASHSTGIYRNDFMGALVDFRETLPDKLRFIEPKDRFRNSFQYNNLMFGLMARVIEILGKKSWEELVFERLFSPAGMDASTHVTDPNLETLNMQTPYLTDVNDEIREVSINALRFFDYGGAAGIVTNANDMAKWIQLHLNGGKIGNEEVIKETVLKETYSPVNVLPISQISKPTFPITYANGGYGLGWVLGYYRGIPAMSHGGNTLGFSTDYILLPSMNIGVFVSTTTGEDFVAHSLVSQYVIDLLLGEDPWLNLTTACTFPEPWIESPFETFGLKYLDIPLVSNTKYQMPQSKVKPGKFMKPKYRFDAYEGVFGNFGYENITVFESDDTLMLEYGRTKFSLMQIDEDTFYGIGQGDFWMIPLLSVRFQSSIPGSEIIDEVILPIDINPPVFVRDLKMSDAYPPPNPSECGHLA